MSFLKKMLGSNRARPSEDRVRVCSQCGMPVTAHKDWCSILNGQKDGNQAQFASATD